MSNKRLSAKVTTILRIYRALSVRFEFKEKYKVHGIITNEVSQDKEKQKEIIYKQIDHALSLLNPTERMIIEYKYISSDRITDKDIYIAMGIKKDKYYQHKKQALLTISKYDTYLPGDVSCAVCGMME